MFKKLKKLFVLLFVFVFCGSLASCNKNDLPDEPKFDSITVSEAIDIANAAGENETEEYYVTGKVTEISKPQFGEMYISDGDKEIYVYGVTGEDGTYFNKLTEKPEVGDTVVLYGKLGTFKGEPEMKRSILKQLIRGEKDPLDLTQYEKLSIKDARSKAKGTKVNLTGVVAFVTKGGGMTPNGYFLVDETGSTYVYDQDNAASLEVGNKINIAGETALYINPKETESAKLHGYNGAFQITNVNLISNDKGSNDFNKSWIKESTVKEMVENKDFTNMTGNIYKVNAVVKRAPDQDFVNYIFNDLDNATGSYTYTSNNGKDFSYLDVYDGKICTVYLSVINYKAAASKLTPRFTPILVSDDNFAFDKKDAPKFTIDYKVAPTFKQVYNVNPKQEMITSYSDTLLGFDNVVVSYESSNKNAITFDVENGKTILNTHNNGKSNVTVTASLNGVTATKIIEVEYKSISIEDAKTVKEVVDAPLDSTHLVRGIVTSSLVNKTGFYLTDDTGVIPVLVADEMMKEFAIGDEVYLEGKRVNKGRFDYKGNEKDVFGTTAFECSKLLVNKQGNHSFNESLVKKSTVDELNDANIKEDFTTTIYEVECKIVLPEGQWAVYELQSLTDDTKGIQLYCSSKNQYNMLESYVGKTCTVQLSLCNWNGKSHYKGCVISVTDGTTKKVNNLNFR